MSRLDRFRPLSIDDKDRIREEIVANCDLVGDCWVYRGTANPATSYGMKKIDGRTRTVSRFMLCYATRESLDRSGDACHDTTQCPYKACCNPRHLFWGTHEDNCEIREQDKRDARKLHVVAPPVPLGHVMHSERTVYVPESEQQESRTVYAQESGREITGAVGAAA